ncbi:MAG: hypothetical protein LAN61_16015 [Acidobacteriia bacterium]|nr:hypothetical protein [Terriglobia bacterium]
MFDKVRLEELLRFVFSGGVFLIALFLTGPSFQRDALKIKGIGDATVLVGLVMLLGSLIYTLNRALTFPLTIFPLALTLPALFRVYPFEKRFWVPFQMSELERHMEDMRYGLRERKDVLYSVWNDWGTQVHFLYSCSLAILLALIWGGQFEGHAHRKLLLFTAVVFYLGGLVHHVRLLYSINVVWKDEINRKLSKNPTPTETQSR